MSVDPSRRNNIAIGEEHFFLEKQLRDQELVRVRTIVESQDELIRDSLRSDQVTVERVQVNREIRSYPDLRREGDVLIVPVVEEQVVVSKRLILKEELRITRRVRSQPFEQAVPVRRTRAVVEREPLREANHQPKEARHGPNHHSSLRHNAGGPGGQAGDRGPDRRR